MNPEEIRKEFPIFSERPELVYLDSAATSQKPGTVIEKISSFYSSKNANVGRGLYRLAGEATVEYQRARSEVADFIGAESDEVIFLRNTTEATNLLASSLDLDGDIVLSEMAHHSEQLPWRRKAEREGLEIKYIPTKDKKLDMEAAKDIIDEDTALVSISHISNVFGVENPVEELADIAHENDALISVDGAQSVPRKPVDVKDMDVDFLSFSGHKMLAPNGIGCLYGRKDILKDMEPYQVGGGMIRTVKKDEVEWEEVPEKFEAGTPNVAGAVGLAEAISYLDEIGMDEVYRHDRELAEKARSELENIQGVDVLAPKDEEISVVSFTMNFAHPHDIAEILNQENVAVRAGHHCAQPQMEKIGISGTTRVSPYIYNTEEDISKFIEAVKKVKSVFG